VLIVEDNLDTVHSLVLLLRDMGHRVDYAINGYAALEAARRSPPEIVLMDLGLPGMDGFEVSRRLKKEPALEGVRIFAVTAYGDDEARARALEAGCEAHLVKPVDARELARLIAK
jgi:CheY-like chemotaxis protein